MKAAAGSARPYAIRLMSGPADPRAGEATLRKERVNVSFVRSDLRARVRKQRTVLSSLHVRNDTDDQEDDEYRRLGDPNRFAKVLRTLHLARIRDTAGAGVSMVRNMVKR